jgi:hypothetical protein
MNQVHCIGLKEEMYPASLKLSISQYWKIDFCDWD